MQQRRATTADIGAITAIYAHHVLNGTGTFEEEPPAIEEMRRRFETAAARGWHWLVAEDGSGVLGYAGFGQFRERSAYRFCAEDSIYVRDDVRGQGVGKALVGGVLAEAEAAGFRQMIAVIGDAANAGSIGVHATMGFRQIGVMRAAGLKFGRWLDVVWMQRAVGAADGDVPAG